MKNKSLFLVIICMFLSTTSSGAGEIYPSSSIGLTGAISADFDSSGSLMLLALDAGPLKLVDPDTGEIFHTFYDEAVNFPIRADFFAEGDRFLATRADSATVYDVDTGATLAFFDATATSGIMNSAISPTTGEVALAFQTGVFTYDADLTNETEILSGFSPLSLEYSNDGSILAVALGGVSKVLKIIDAATKDELREIPLPEYPYEILLSDDGSIVFVAMSNKKLAAWNTSDGTLYNNYTGLSVSPAQLTLSSNNQVLGARDSLSYEFWDVASATLLEPIELRNPTRATGAATVSPAGELVFSTSEAEVLFIDPLTHEVSRTLLGIPSLDRFILNADATKVIATTNRNYMLELEVSSGKVLRNFQKSDASSILNRLTLSPDGNTIAAGTPSGFIHLFDYVTGAETGSFQASIRSIHSVSFTPDGTRLVVTTQEYDAIARTYVPTATLWDIDGLQLVDTYTATYPTTYSLRAIIAAVTPSGSKLLLTTAQGLESFDMATGESEGIIYNSSGIYDLTFSPDNSLLIVSGYAVLDAETFEVLGQTGIATVDRSPGVSITADNRFIITAYNSTALVDWENEEVVRTFSGGGPLAFLPDGENFLSAYKGSIGVWNNVFGPAEQVSDLTASLEGDVIDISWSEGSGIATAIFAKEDAGFDDVPEPSDKLNYTGSSIYGEGDQLGDSGWFCIYDGYNLSTTSRGFTPGATVKFIAYEYDVAFYDGDRQPFYNKAMGGNMAEVDIPGEEVPPPVESGSDSSSSGCFIEALSR